MASKSVEIPGIGPVTLVKRRGNSNIRMSFARNGTVRVSLPFWVPYQVGIEFALARQDWIQTHRPSRAHVLHDGDRLGKAHRLYFVAGGTRSKTTVRTGMLKVMVTHPPELVETAQEVQKAAERGALKALKMQADRLLPERLRTLAALHGFSYASVSTKRLSSRWGSCSNTKHITLNIFLMQLPWHLIDYVLLHELVHTEHLDHSAHFWRRFTSVLPDAKRVRRELKAHQTAIIPIRD